MKKICIVLSLIFAFSMCFACGKPIEEPPKEETYEKIATYKRTYNFLGEDVFPIGAWMAPPYDNKVTPIPANYITDQAYKDIADCGINSIYALYDRCDNRVGVGESVNSEVMKAIKFAEKYNIAYLSRDWNEMALMDEDDAKRMYDTLYVDFSTSPAFSGMLVIDEPGFAHFDNLKEMKKNHAKYFKDQLFYVNMMPTYASENQLLHGAASGGGGPSTIAMYTKYVQEYLAKVKPEVFSYDFYPMMGDFPNVDKNYFLNMSIVAEECSKAKIPFWPYIQTTSWGRGVRISSQAEVDWMVNTALAYGAKGIQYFSYWTPFDDSGSHPGYYPSSSDEQIGALVSHDGKKQDMYYKVQKTNTHLKEVGKILLDCGFAGIIQNGESPDEIPKKDKLEKYRQLESVSGDNAIVSCMDKNGKTVLYVVNNSLTKNSAKIKLTFNKSQKFSLVQKATTTAAEGKELELTLDAGEGVLVSL